MLIPAIFKTYFFTFVCTIPAKICSHPPFQLLSHRLSTRPAKSFPRKSSYLPEELRILASCVLRSQDAER